MTLGQCLTDELEPIVVQSQRRPKLLWIEKSKSIRSPNDGFPEDAIAEEGRFAPLGQKNWPSATSLMQAFVSARLNFCFATVATIGVECRRGLGVGPKRIRHLSS
jgi:hypothetical protein